MLSDSSNNGKLVLPHKIQRFPFHLTKHTLTSRLMSTSAIFSWFSGMLGFQVVISLGMSRQWASRGGIGTNSVSATRKKEMGFNVIVLLMMDTPLLFIFETNQHQRSTLIWDTHHFMLDVSHCLTVSWTSTTRCVLITFTCLQSFA